MRTIIKGNPTDNPDCYQEISKETFSDSITIRFFQNYEESPFDSEVDLSKNNDVSINLPIEALKFFKKIIDNSFQEIEQQKKYESEIENEELRLQFDPPMTQDESHDDDLYDDDLKTYFNDNPDARG